MRSILMSIYQMAANIIYLSDRTKITPPKWELLTGDEVDTWETNFLPVQSDTRTLAEKKLLRLEPQVTRSYMDNLRTNGGLCSPVLVIAGLAWRGRRDLNPRPPA